jgi:hypothetical protein
MCSSIAGTTAVLEPPEPTGLIVWDLYNRITASARDEVHYQRRVGLENLAGDVLNIFLCDPCSDEPIKNQREVRAMDTAQA